MKKFILIATLAISSVSCKAQGKPIPMVSSETTVVKTNDMLVGQQSKEELLKIPYSLWFQPNHDNYKPESAIISELKKNTNEISITIFMGTWCEDSQQQVPGFYKVLETIGFDNQKVTLITVDKTKTTPDHLEKDKNITNVPTFIFYKNGKELHRIVERPIESLERDMLKIITAQPYKHAYEN